MKPQAPNRLIDRLERFFSPVTDHRVFNKVTGAIAWLNPFALLPQLSKCIVMDDLAAVSAMMYVIFALLQVVFALVAIKSRNLGMFLSMTVSVIISLSIIVLTVMKGGVSRVMNYHPFFYSKTIFFR